MGLAFKKAEKKQAKLRLALTGPSGSGKTFSALSIADGIGKKVAVIDTENHSASLYADDFGFYTLELDPPYTVDKYLMAIKAAVEAGYEVLIIDSISHAWAGEGGLLEKKSAIDIRGGNQYTNWASVTKEHEHFKAVLLNCDIHLIVTMRSRQDYVLDDKGKPKKVGMAPIQRDGLEYEFTLVLDMAMDHNAAVSKTRVKGFDGKIFQPTKKTGEELLAWLMSGKAEPAAAPVFNVVQTPPESNPTPASIEPEEATGIIKNGKFQALPAEPEIESAVLTVATIDSHKLGPDKYLYTITDDEGIAYTTFSSTIYARAEESRVTLKPLAVKFKRQPGKAGTKYEGQIFLNLIEAERHAFDTIKNH